MGEGGKGGGGGRNISYRVVNCIIQSSLSISNETQ